MLRRLYDWTVEKADSRHAQAWLAGISFAESSFFPIPPDVLLVPMALAARARTWFFALITMLSSVAGAAAGYAIGWLAFETMGRPILDFYGLMEAFAGFQEEYRELGIWIVALGGMTPFPFKLVTIASGTVEMNFALFMLACLGTRTVRFFIPATLLWFFGPPIRTFIEKRLGLAMGILFALVAGGFAVLALF